MAYFENLAFEYRYERAVAEGFLVDYDVVNVHSDVRINGIFLKEGEQVDSIDPVSGAKQLDLLEDERVFDSTKIERLITAPDANRKVLLELKRYAEEHEERYGRFPKILIFADNDQPHTSHADQSTWPATSSAAVTSSSARSPLGSTVPCSASASFATAAIPPSS